MARKSESKPARRTGDDEIARLARALAHPARVRILRHLVRSGACVCGEIVEVMPLAQATVSQHLKVLKEAGLIQGEVEGPRVCYGANPAVLRSFVRGLEALAPEKGDKV